MNSSVSRPANPTTNPHTADILARISQLGGGGKGSIYSGVFTLEGHSELLSATGHAATVIGVEYCRKFGIDDFATAAEAIAWQDFKEGLIAHSREGGIIRVLSHFPNPTNPTYGGLRDKHADVDAILTDGTPARGRWLALLDEIAKGFQDLARHGATVIYGPLHEMNCGGFWWGINHEHMGAERHSALYRDIFDRICNHHKCDNVLWLWNPLGHDPLVMESYPGDDVVDLVALDIYDRTLAPYVENYRRMLECGKPLVLGEFGPMRYDADASLEPPYDCTSLVEELAEHWPEAKGFMFWGGDFLPTHKENAQGMMKDFRVLDRVSFLAA